MQKGKETKPHIGIFGRRNYGKSSFINALTGQDVSIVSPQPGTTTDPVKKSIEIPGIGPAIIIDTAGIDDAGELGEQRVERSVKVMKQIDLAVLLLNRNTFGQYETELISRFEELEVPFMILHNKSDEEPLTDELKLKFQEKIIDFSAIKPVNKEKVIDVMRKLIPESVWQKKTLLGDFLSYGDVVLLITPIDSEAPEGRLILPQVQAIRDILDNDCVAIVLKEREVDAFLKKHPVKPKLAVTDSSVFLKANASVPVDIPLTGFSILLAYHKGNFNEYLEGTPKISELLDGDRILLLESCSHHVSCDDIGRVKIPRWLRGFTGKQLEFDVVPGLNNLKRAISEYALVIQCGGCVVTRRQLMNRLQPAVNAKVPITNYGMAIAYMQGVYERAVQIFTKGAAEIDYL